MSGKKMQFSEGFDVTYKNSPNRVDRNNIVRGFKEGLTPEEIAFKTGVRVRAVKLYDPDAPKEGEKTAPAKK